MLLAQQDTKPLIQFTLAPLFQDNGIPLAVIGMLVVFMALVLLVTFITLLPRILNRLVEAAPAPETTLGREDELSEEMVAVIAAAVSEVMDKPHRIVRIRGLTPEDLGWSLKGRMQHHQSHSFKHQDGR